jgi:hypothetical protein
MSGEIDVDGVLTGAKKIYNRPAVPHRDRRLDLAQGRESEVARQLSSANSEALMSAQCLSLARS